VKQAGSATRPRLKFLLLIIERVRQETGRRNHPRTLGVRALVFMA